MKTCICVCVNITRLLIKVTDKPTVLGGHKKMNVKKNVHVSHLDLMSHKQMISNRYINVYGGNNTMYCFMKEPMILQFRFDMSPRKALSIAKEET